MAVVMLHSRHTLRSQSSRANHMFGVGKNVRRDRPEIAKLETALWIRTIPTDARPDRNLANPLSIYEDVERNLRNRTSPSVPIAMAAKTGNAQTA